jgi:DNA-binding beta-propeller fold protein YncE
LAVSGTNLFVANANNNTIGEYNATSGSAINASLVSGYVISPYGIAVSGTNLFVANYGNNTIGEFNATTGAVINASLVSGVTGPTSIAFLAVPEPSTYVLFGLCALMLVIGYRLRTA